MSPLHSSMTMTLSKTRPPLTDFQRKVYREVHKTAARTAEQIAQRMGLPSGQYIGRALQRLYEKGYVVSTAEGREVRILRPDGTVDVKVQRRGGKWLRA